MWQIHRPVTVDDMMISFDGFKLYVRWSGVTATQIWIVQLDLLISLEIINLKIWWLLQCTDMEVFYLSTLSRLCEIFKKYFYDLILCKNRFLSNTIVYYWLKFSKHTTRE